MTTEQLNALEVLADKAAAHYETLVIHYDLVATIENSDQLLAEIEEAKKKMRGTEAAWHWAFRELREAA